MAFTQGKAEEQKNRLREILERHGLRPTNLAELAGLDRSTITRFMNNPRKNSKLSTTTMEKIEQAAAQIPQQIQKIPVSVNKTFAKDECIESTVAFNKSSFFYVMIGESLCYRGINKGDILVINAQITPKAGDIVQAAYIHEEQKQIIMRLYSPPFLLNCGIIGDEKPAYLIGVDKIEILGVAEYAIKPLIKLSNP